MICRTTQEFQNRVLTQMTFTPSRMENYTIYQNKEHPELGYFIKYSREGYYDL